MTWFRKLRVAVAIALGGLLLGGCSSSDDEPAADPASSPAAAEASSSSSSPSASPTADASCQVKGFVPSTTIELEDARPVVVYARRVGLAPGTSWGSPDAELGRMDLVPLKVRPDDPTVQLSPAERQQILASGAGPVEGGAIADTVRTRARIKNDTGANQTYLLYRGSSVYTGTWRIKRCGAPDNDGSSVQVLTGRYSTVTKIRPFAVARCGVPASGSRVDRYAAQRACRDI